MSNSPDTYTVLKAIADRIEARRTDAAYAHYPTLRIQTQNIHDTLSAAVAEIGGLVGEWRTALADDVRVAPDFVAPGTTNHPYKVIAPTLVDNVHRSADFLLAESRPVGPVGVERAGETAPLSSDFLKLGVAARSFLDALVQTAYQLATFDGRQLNYKFLQSLMSFAGVAPAALHANIVSPEIQAALDAFMALPSRDRTNSAFTKDAHKQFPQRLEVAADLAALPSPQRQNIRLIFCFCSDMIHAGYISTLALDDSGGAVILGYDGDAFVPRAENFAEVKQRVLETCAGAYADLLLPVLGHAMRTMLSTVTDDWTELLDRHRVAIGKTRDILGRQLVEPIRASVITGEQTARIECSCGGHCDLISPHFEWNRFCGSCGARFVLLELPDEVDYVISDLGAGDVLGNDAPKIAELDPALKDKLKRIVRRHKPTRDGPDVRFKLITDLARCDVDTLEVGTQITAAPLPGTDATLRAFVPSKSLERCMTVRIQCNCGTQVDYATAAGTLVCQCGICGSRIGLIGVSGGVCEIPMLDSNGGEFSAPVQARNRFIVPGVATDNVLAARDLP
ncbi:hypothetical protein [Sphingomonas sp.]|uniref:hypothetical protein n=1 Tax=Sphingomonas sp. TaxID=28214 RepID=UPI0025F0F55F|nr:hypothetical protein [Sphingomonas sp.]